MKYYIIAGERSGDLHASNLIKYIKQEDATAQIRAWGGDMMQEAGATLMKHYRDLAFMGFWEVAKNLPTIMGFMKECRQDILAYKPNVVVLVDYAGFNMRIAKFAKKQGIKVFYYISPKVWAWNQSRAFKLKENVDRLFVIFPFEVEFFKRYAYEVDYVGNPLLDAVTSFRPNPLFRQENNLPDKPIIALLPGSRRQEVEKMLEVMLGVVTQFNQYQFVIAAIHNLPESFYETFSRVPHVSIVYEQTYDLLANAEAALVTSGTATLETALFEVPQVVCYKTGAVTYLIAKSLIQIEYISLVNLIAGKEVVKELIQENFNVPALVYELKKILKGSGFRTEQLYNYKMIKDSMGEPGASERAARLMVHYLKQAEASKS
jgi:lipid-A-disaccharide synthase